MRAGTGLLLALLSLGCNLGCGTTELPPPATGSAAPASDATARHENARRFWVVLARAGEAGRSARHAEAVDLYRQALVLRPDHEDSLYYLGNSLAALGQIDAALATYERLTRVSPEGSSRAWMRLGRMHGTLRDGRPRDAGRARVAFERAFSLDPDSGAALNLAELEAVAGDSRAARSALSVQHRAMPQHPAPPFLLGWLAWRAGDPVEAGRWLGTLRAGVKPKASPVAWSEEGDVKDAPRRRWLALAEHSLVGAWWMPLVDRCLKGAGPQESEMASVFSCGPGVVPAQVGVAAASAPGAAP